MGAILPSDDLLQYDRHLLLVYDIAGGCHVGFGVAVIDGGIDALDGACQHLQHVVLVVVPRYHVCGVYACEGLVVGIFQE